MRPRGIPWRLDLRFSYGISFQDCIAYRSITVLVCSNYNKGTCLHSKTSSANACLSRRVVNPVL